MLRITFLLIKITLGLIILAILAAASIIFYFAQQLPNYDTLMEHQPTTASRIYSREGILIKEYYKDHYRIYTPIHAIPDLLIKAFLSAEDKNFFSHTGVDLESMLRAIRNDFFNLTKGKRLEGGSTITQQVVKNFLLSSERSLARKIKEAILAYKISKILSKERILEIYLNEIYLGNNSYGVAAAARSYFNKSLNKLNLAEIGFIAALPKKPSFLNPIKNPEGAKARRDYVINRMLSNGYITEQEAIDAVKESIQTNPPKIHNSINSDYYAEYVKQLVIGWIGEDDFYKKGLTIITSMNIEYQNHLNSALKDSISNFDKKNGYRGVLKLSDSGHTKNSKKPFGTEIATVIQVESDSIKAIIQKSQKTITLKKKNLAWVLNTLKAKSLQLSKLIHKEDKILVRLIDEEYFLEQIPELNGAMMVMNYETGEILALSGGYDYELSSFNRALSANRQIGSTIKTFIYLAAFEQNLPPNMILEDEPIEIYIKGSKMVWRPKNYKSNFLGKITMRRSFELSRNLATIRLGQQVSLDSIAEITNRFGINEAKLQNLAILLGALETTLEKLTAAYASLANQGNKVTPHFIECIKDFQGKILYKRNNQELRVVSTSESLDSQSKQEVIPDPFSIDQARKNTASLDPFSIIDQTKNNQIPQIISLQGPSLTDPASAYQITSLLEGTRLRGTASQAYSKLKYIAAGKTGTTNESKDVWYIEYFAEPKIIVSSYLGYDLPKSLGKRVTGATAALPAVAKFVESLSLDDKSKKTNFPIPDNIKLIQTDLDSGLPISELDGGSAKKIMEAYKITKTPLRNNKPSQSNPFLEKSKKFENFTEQNNILPDLDF